MPASGRWLRHTHWVRDGFTHRTVVKWTTGFNHG